MPKVDKSQSQLHADFIESIDLLELACHNFDCVTFNAAKNIANLLHQLVDDRGQNESHITKLGLADSLRIWRLADVGESAHGFSNPLCGVMFGIGHNANGTKVARAQNVPPYLHDGHVKNPAQIDDVCGWLDQKIIRLESGELLSRRNLIRFVRDQDAGAHSDKRLDELYVNFRSSLSIDPGSTIEIMGVVTKVESLLELQNPALASLRQIAHEFLSSVYSAPDTQANRPRCMIYKYGSNGELLAVLRPKGYKQLPINPPADILIETDPKSPRFG